MHFRLCLRCVKLNVWFCFLSSEQLGVERRNTTSPSHCQSPWRNCDTIVSMSREMTPLETTTSPSHSESLKELWYHCKHVQRNDTPGNHHISKPLSMCSEITPVYSSWRYGWKCLWVFIPEAQGHSLHQETMHFKGCICSLYYIDSISNQDLSLNYVVDY
jgi:hypothetical protein